MEVDLVTRFWGAITRAFQRLSRAVQRFAAGLDAPARPGSPLLQPAVELVRAHPGSPEALPGEARDAGGAASRAVPLSRFERDELLPHGDFSDADEEERFAALPPIPPEAVDDVDWDALARALTRNA